MLCKRLFGDEIDFWDMMELAPLILRQTGFAMEYKLFQGTVAVHKMDLPCDVHAIEHVCATRPQSWYDAYIEGTAATRLVNYRVDQSGNLGIYNESATNFNSINDNSVTTYVVNSKVFSKPLGAMLSHKNVNNECLYFNFESIAVDVLYVSLLKDADGYLKLTEKAFEALAHYMHYIHIRKKFNMKEASGDQVTLAKEEMERAVAHARTPNAMSQNEIDDILNVFTSWNKKRHNLQHRQ